MRLGYFSQIAFFYCWVLILLSGCEKENVNAGFAAVDEMLIYNMGEYNIPAMSLAIIGDEKLAYVKSYGIANTSIKRKAANTDLYRIASVSKPVTAIAILKLVEDGVITLDQTVFGSNGILENDFGIPPAGSNKELITVRHLLDHTSGWIDSPNDPMFASSTPAPSGIIEDILRDRPLATIPGTTYHYLNFGYCVLGRVIEKITGMSYESFVTTTILQPCGISEMKIGGNSQQERFPDEVIYYQTEYDPYWLNVTRMDAAAGWIASATDLARLMVKIDRNPSKLDLIPSQLLNEFYFGYSEWYHYGEMAGASAILKRVDDRFAFVLLMNTRPENNSSLILDDLNKRISRQIFLTPDWPSRDLF